MRKQRTIVEKVSCTGVGLHSGVPVQLTLLPARAGSGVVAVCNDGDSPVEFPCHPRAVQSTNFATTLGREGATVSTVEHLLAACFGLGIDNVRVVIDGPELPVMDGSAAAFVHLIRSAGIFEQRAPCGVLRFRRPIEVRDGERWIRVEPARRFRVSYSIDFDHPVVGRQNFEVDGLDPDHFERELAGARTFAFLRDVQGLWDAGLAKGGSLENTIVLDDDKPLNPEGLRWPDEFVRHKVLDLYGDLALLGLPIEGHIQVERGGHTLHQKLVSAILHDREAWFIHGAERSVESYFELRRIGVPA